MHKFWSFLQINNTEIFQKKNIFKKKSEKTPKKGEKQLIFAPFEVLEEACVPTYGFWPKLVPCTDGQNSQLAKSAKKR
jgi:hypothetical protein